MIIENVWIYDELMDLARETLCKIEIEQKNGSKSKLQFYKDKYLAITALISFIIIENTDPDFIKENVYD